MARVEDEVPPDDELGEDLGAVSELERREAEGLARVLAGAATREPGQVAEQHKSTGDAASVDEMLEVSALLRARGKWELSQESQRAIFEDLVAARQRSARKPERPRRVFRWWWLLPLPPSLAGVAALLFFVTTRPNGTARREATSASPEESALALTLPAVPPALLAAQARVILDATASAAPGASAFREQESLALADYNRELGQYRGQWLSALHQRYQP